MSPSPWIAVDERPPNAGDVVLCQNSESTAPETRHFVGVWLRGRFCIPWLGVSVPVFASHWMPLPQEAP